MTINGVIQPPATCKATRMKPHRHDWRTLAVVDGETVGWCRWCGMLRLTRFVGGKVQHRHTKPKGALC